MSSQDTQQFFSIGMDFEGKELYACLIVEPQKSLQLWVEKEKKILSLELSDSSIYLVPL